jgi:hypothetical protein
MGMLDKDFIKKQCKAINKTTKQPSKKKNKEKTSKLVLITTK